MRGALCISAVGRAKSPVCAPPIGGAGRLVRGVGSCACADTSSTKLSSLQADSVLSLQLQAVYIEASIATLEGHLDASLDAACRYAAASPYRTVHGIASDHNHLQIEVKHT